jgi:glyoxylate/hydroxypyruvate reductase A
MSFLYKSDPVRGAQWARLFAEKAPQLDFHIWPQTGDAQQVRYLAAWQPPPDLAHTFPNLEVMFGIGAGVDHIDFAALPSHVPLVRMIEPGIIGGMVEYLSLAVLAQHRQWDEYAQQQRAGDWHPLRVLPAARRRIGVLGLGILGQAALEKLSGFGFSCAGWSRSAHAIAGIECHAGSAGLPAFLARTDILICLLPLTDDTRGILNHALFEQLPRGAMLINVGRGPHLVQDDLLRALESGQISRAVLDVCEPEPLPAGHWLWSHPRVTLTPHIASMTQPDSAAEVVLDNIRRHEAGLAMHGLVDRTRGY